MKFTSPARFSPKTSMLVFALTLNLCSCQSLSHHSSDDREKALQDFKNHNYRAALKDFTIELHETPKDYTKFSEDLTSALQCLSAIANDYSFGGIFGRPAEFDRLLTPLCKRHHRDWRALQIIARAYQRIYNEGFHHPGFFVTFGEGELRTGHPSSSSLDDYGFLHRQTTLRILQDAVSLCKASGTQSDLARLYLDTASALRPESFAGKSRELRSLTDFSAADSEAESDEHHSAAFAYFSRGWSSENFAPTLADGSPLFHERPQTWDSARSDGERWRWVLHEAKSLDPALSDESDMILASFSFKEFGVHTLGYVDRHRFQSQSASAKDPDTLHLLPESDSIARLASGVRRFTLPPEMNYITIWKRIAAARNGSSTKAAESLARCFEDRRQLDKAAEWWERAGSREKAHKIIGKWGEIQLTQANAAGADVAFAFRYRNARRVTFTARALLFDDYLASLRKGAIRASVDNYPKIESSSELASRFERNPKDPLLSTTEIRWRLELSPDHRHFDRIISVSPPITNAGAYWIEAQVEAGNKSAALLWIHDLAVMTRPVNNGILFMVTDALTGAPVIGANLEVFGQGHLNNSGVDSKFFMNCITRTTDSKGLYFAPREEINGIEVLAAFASFREKRSYYYTNPLHWSQAGNQPSNKSRTFLVMSSPLYRPGQTVQFKAWLREPDPANPTESNSYAQRIISLSVSDPHSQVIVSTELQSDALGGIDWEFNLDKDASLGIYTLKLSIKDPDQQTRALSSTYFQVEEFKKPELELRIEGPESPPLLGQSFTATIRAHHIFGSPLSQGRVKVQVKRRPTQLRNRPRRDWSWLFGARYGEFPGHDAWDPHGFSLNAYLDSHSGAELVFETDSALQNDGTLKITIDTNSALLEHPDSDHSYEIEVQLTDSNRASAPVSASTIVTASRKSLLLDCDLERGFTILGDSLVATISVRTTGVQPAPKKGHLEIIKMSHGDKGRLVEEKVWESEIELDASGTGQVRYSPSESGRHRLSFKMTASNNRTYECIRLVPVVEKSGKSFQYFPENLEIIPERREYAVGETARLLIKTRTPNSTVYLFTPNNRPEAIDPKIIKVRDNTAIFEYQIQAADSPRIYIDAVSVSKAEMHSVSRAIHIPPIPRLLNIEIDAPKAPLRPSDLAELSLKVRDSDGKPFPASLCLTIFDKSLSTLQPRSSLTSDIAVEFLEPESRPRDLRVRSGLWIGSGTYLFESASLIPALGSLGTQLISDSTLPPVPFEAPFDKYYWRNSSVIGIGDFTLAFNSREDESSRERPRPEPEHSMFPSSNLAQAQKSGSRDRSQLAIPVIPGSPLIVRKDLRDTAYWNGRLQTDSEGRCSIKVKMPENLTAWTVQAWGMGHGTRVGQASAELLSRKNLMIQLQAPRFFVETDELDLSGFVQNDLDSAQDISTVLELDGPTLALLDSSTATRVLKIESGQRQRLDWRVKVLKSGEAIVRLKALSEAESDGVEQRFPVYVHGVPKTVSFMGVLRPKAESAALTLSIPGTRKVNDSKLIVRYSPSLAWAMVDALPYMVEFPYGCTEQTLNRFLPTVITQRVLMDMGLDLAEIEKIRSSASAPEALRHKNPVFSNREVRRIAKEGVKRLTEMQGRDGGWGWFSGASEQSWPHTTATVVRGLLLARDNDLAIDPGVLERGLTWLANHQSHQVRLLDNAPSETKPYKTSASDSDALVFWVLVKGDQAKGDRTSGEAHDKMLHKMKDYLFRDYEKLSVYALAMLGMAYHKLGDMAKRDILIQRIEQYLKEDPDNQTAWLELPNSGYWWYWYGSEYETLAYYLKLLAMTNPGSPKAIGLVKYLLNNRKHGIYWNSTRDTALCLEAIADYMKASGEDQPDMTVEVFLDGRKLKEAKIDRTNLFTFDGTVELQGDAIETGEHKLELRRKGKGPVYFNAYLSYFSKEELITKAGLELKVERQYYKLEEIKDSNSAKASATGQARSEKFPQFKRTPLANGAELERGDLVEVDLAIEAKNDYEYLLFEDLKAAGFEPVDQHSGNSFTVTNGVSLHTHMELRDEKVAFFVRWLPRGKHSLSYRMRAEIPGKFSALPTLASAMYAPELKANSDELKIKIANED